MTYLERYTLLAATGTDNDGRLVDEEQKPKTSEARLLQSLTSIKEAPELVTLQRGFVIVVQEAHEMNDKDASMLVAAEAVPPPSGLRSLRPTWNLRGRWGCWGSKSPPKTGTTGRAEWYPTSCRGHGPCLLWTGATDKNGIRSNEGS